MWSVITLVAVVDRGAVLAIPFIMTVALTFADSSSSMNTQAIILVTAAPIVVARVDLAAQSSIATVSTVAFASVLPRGSGKALGCHVASMDVRKSTIINCSASCNAVTLIAKLALARVDARAIIRAVCIDIAVAMAVLAFIDRHALFAVARVARLACARVGARVEIFAGSQDIAGRSVTGFDSGARCTSALVANRTRAFVFTRTSHLADTSGTTEFGCRKATTVFGVAIIDRIAVGPRTSVPGEASATVFARIEVLTCGT